MIWTQVVVTACPGGKKIYNDIWLGNYDLLGNKWFVLKLTGGMKGRGTQAQNHFVILTLI